MRARLALVYAGIQVELREVDLNDMPAVLCELVPDNQTVPVLHLPDGRIHDESWDIVLWAVRENDPDGWLGENESNLIGAEQWIEMNDYSFKDDLDHYKYADRYPEHPAEYYRSEAELFLQDLEEQLNETVYLLGDRLSIADIGVLPFIRQFACVDKNWFEQAPYPRVRAWLEAFLESALFAAIMGKYPVWQPGDDAVIWG